MKIYKYKFKIIHQSLSVEALAKFRGSKMAACMPGPLKQLEY